MADCNSPTRKSLKYTCSSFFNNSPRLFTGNFTLKGFTDNTESIMSPTSILDTKLFSAKTLKPETKSHFDSRGIGLGLVDALTLTNDEGSDPKISNKPERRMVLCGSQLKIQIPPLPSSSVSPVDSPKSPGDFGIKTRNSVLLGCFSPYGSLNADSPRVFSGCLSASEMELSEDYTRVISHGPNPKTTHIFDDCIVESCCGDGFGGSGKENGFVTNNHISMSYPCESFLSFCKSCNKNIGHGSDIYIYRGEMAFCSTDCRYKEIMDEEGMGKSESDDVYGSCSL